MFSKIVILPDCDTPTESGTVCVQRDRLLATAVPFGIVITAILLALVARWVLNRRRQQSARDADTEMANNAY